MARLTSVKSQARFVAAFAVVAVACGAANAGGVSAAQRAEHSVPYATASYAIRNVGGPSTSQFSSFGQPLGFNDSGQFVGVAFPATPPTYQNCIAWTGTAWVDLEGATSLNCYPTSGISNANKSGVFAAAGATYIATTDNYVAFYALVGPKSATLTAFSGNGPSYLYAMTAAGLAAGYSYYAPYGGFSFSEPTVTTSGGPLALLQPGCTTVKPNCMQAPLNYYAGPSLSGRSINSSGTVLSYALNPTLGTYIEYTSGKSNVAYQFSLPPDGANGSQGVRGLDDHGNVVYYEYDSAQGKYLGWVYSPISKKGHNFGTLPGNSCTQYIPIAINGPGRVLGIAQACSFAADQTYWTWDSTNGLVGVTFDHAGFSSATLDLINDKGEIAGDFYTSSGVHHWSYLVPPAKL